MQISIFLEHLLQAHEQSGKTIDEVFALAQKCSINGIETNAGFLSSQSELQKKLSDAGLSVTQLYENYSWEDFNNQQKMEKQIETAIKTGASKILFIPPYFSDLSKETVQTEVEKVKIMIRQLCTMSRTAGSEGLTVTMEDFDNLQSPSSKICFLQEYIKDIPELKITFDTGNFLANGESILEAYSVLKDRIVNVHCKDRLADVSSCITGTGIIPFKTVFANLKKDNYNGNYTIEHFDINNQLEAIEKSPANLIKLMEKL